MGTSRALSVYLCVCAGLLACAPAAHAQIVPVSRWSQLSYSSFSSIAPSTSDTQTLTDWVSGHTAVSNARETLTLDAGSIVIDDRTSGFRFNNGSHTNPISSGSNSSTATVLTFDILAPATYQLAGQLGLGFSTAQIDLRLLGAAVPLYANSAPGIGTVDYATSGSLAPGRYVLSVTVSSPSMELGPLGMVTANFTVVPSPAAASVLAGAAASVLAAAAAAFASRRRR